MKKFKIKSVDNSNPTWTGEYTTIERTNNPFSVGYEDIKVYMLRVRVPFTEQKINLVDSIKFRIFAKQIPSNIRVTFGVEG